MDEVRGFLERECKLFSYLIKRRNEERKNFHNCCIENELLNKRYILEQASRSAWDQRIRVDAIAETAFLARALGNTEYNSLKEWINNTYNH